MPDAASFCQTRHASARHPVRWYTSVSWVQSGRSGMNSEFTVSCMHARVLAIICRTVSLSSVGLRGRTVASCASCLMMIVYTLEVVGMPYLCMSATISEYCRVKMCPAMSKGAERAEDRGIAILSQLRSIWSLVCPVGRESTYTSQTTAQYAVPAWSVRTRGEGKRLKGQSQARIP